MRYSALAIVGIVAVALLSACPDKKPKHPNCDSDKDCKEGETCVNKKCVQCADDGDCQDGEKCVSGGCETDPLMCSSDDDCQDGEECIDGGCKQAPKGTPCDVDTDCADDEDCIEGTCQQPWKNDDPPEVTCELVTVYFDFDQSAIRQDQRDLLQANADCIREAPADRRIKVIGHTDPSGTEEYNIALSERRADSVADYLARLGIDPARFHVIPKGESYPSGEGEDSDRRVEFEWK